jgi:hypothetical protein
MNYSKHIFEQVFNLEQTGLQKLIILNVCQYVGIIFG